MFLLYVIPAGHPLQLLAKTLGLLSLKDLHIGSRIWVTFSNHPSTRGGPHSSHWHTTLYPLDTGHPGILSHPYPSFRWPHLSFFSYSSLHYFAYCPPSPTQLPAPSEFPLQKWHPWAAKLQDVCSPPPSRSNARVSPKTYLWFCQVPLTMPMASRNSYPGWVGGN